MKNREIAEIFNEIAAMLSVEGTATSRFEVRAYQTAALNIAGLQEDVAAIYARGGVEALMEIPGIGKGIAGHIEEYLKTGRIRKYDMLKKKYPIDFTALMKVQGIGAKKCVILYRKLGVRNIDGLRKAVSAHKVRELDGFGERSEEALAKNLSIAESAGGRMLLGAVLPEAEAMIAELSKCTLVKKALIAGSARRMRETVGDLDILVLADDGPKVMDMFEKMEGVERTIIKGPTKTTVQLGLGITCDLRVISPDSFGAAVQYFTGSKAHNIAVRKIAMAKGYKLNEYGLFDGKGRLVSGRDEPDIYGKLGMQWMPPEMREDRGEIKLAQAHKVPKLVELKDLKGDLHTHTKETDGQNSLEEMAEAAIMAGLDYIATTNHTKSLKVAKGMDEKAFTKYFWEVDRLNKKYDGRFTILKGAEVDILKDGSLDLDTKTLKGMDCALGAVHTSFNLPGKAMTARIVRAIESGLIRVLAHPTGRVINLREPYQIDIDRIAEAAAANNVILEIDSFPDRLDLNDTNIMIAAKRKVMFSIDSDAHNVTHYANLRYGVGTARRAWLPSSRIANSMPVDRLMKILRK
jgi:DNA polymerase (family 10)